MNVAFHRENGQSTYRVLLTRADPSYRMAAAQMHFNCAGPYDGRPVVYTGNADQMRRFDTALRAIEGSTVPMVLGPVRCTCGVMPKQGKLGGVYFTECQNPAHVAPPMFYSLSRATTVIEWNRKQAGLRPSAPTVPWGFADMPTPYRPDDGEYGDDGDILLNNRHEEGDYRMDTRERIEGGEA